MTRPFDPEPSYLEGAPAALICFVVAAGLGLLVARVLNHWLEMTTDEHDDYTEDIYGHIHDMWRTINYLLWAIGFMVFVAVMLYAPLF